MNPTIPELAPQGPQLIPHTDAWRRAQSDARKRERKVRRASGNILTQTFNAAKARLQDLDVSGLPPKGAREQLRAARREVASKNKFLPRDLRRKLAREVKIAQ